MAHNDGNVPNNPSASSGQRLLFQSKEEQLNDGSLVLVTKVIGPVDVCGLEDKVIGFFNQGVKYLILDFHNVPYMDSMALSLLVVLVNKYQEGGGDILLSGISDQLAGLFDMLGLLSLFTLHPTPEEALLALNSKKRRIPNKEQ